MNTSPTRRIVRVDQSPMNYRRWNLLLECGHDKWVTAVARPKRTTIKCAHCKV